MDLKTSMVVSFSCNSVAVPFHRKVFEVAAFDSVVFQRGSGQRCIQRCLFKQDLQKIISIVLLRGILYDPIIPQMKADGTEMSFFYKRLSDACIDRRQR